MIKSGLIFCLTLLLSGCATAYQPADFTGGYTETQLDGNIWKVSFKRNQYTDKDRAVDLALLRCAELTLENGYSHFGITGVKIGKEQGTITRNRAGSLTVVSNVNFTGKPSLTNTIVMLKHKPDAGDAVYDAQSLCESLGEKYHQACGGKR